MKIEVEARKEGNARGFSAGQDSKGKKRLEKKGRGENDESGVGRVLGNGDKHSK